MTAFPVLTIAEAKADLADAQTQLDAEQERHAGAGYGTNGWLRSFFALRQAEDALSAARRRLECVKAQQPTVFHDYVGEGL